MSKKRTFEDIEPIIDELLERKRSGWRLEAVRHTDFDDVKQDIKLHVWKKFDLWNQDLPVENWLSSVIHNKIFNIKRNLWGTTAKPCSGCYFNIGMGACSWTSDHKQSSECSLYRKWERKKEGAYNIKIAGPIHGEDGAILHENPSPEEIDYSGFIDKIDTIMKGYLEEGQISLVIYRVFRYLYVEHLDDDVIAKKLNYKSTEKKRSPGYKQISNHRREIIRIIKEILGDEDPRFIGS